MNRSWNSKELGIWITKTWCQKLEISKDRNKFVIKDSEYVITKIRSLNWIPAQTESTLFHTYSLKGRILRVKKWVFLITVDYQDFKRANLTPGGRYTTQGWRNYLGQLGNSPTIFEIFWDCSCFFVRNWWREKNFHGISLSQPRNNLVWDFQ